jgi:hypothetical protein
MYLGLTVVDRIATGIFELTQSKLSMQLNDNRVCSFVLLRLQLNLGRITATTEVNFRFVYLTQPPLPVVW